MVHKASALLLVLSLTVVTLFSASLCSPRLLAKEVDLGQAASIATESSLREAKVQLKVPTRDGRFLAATIHKPKKKGRYPTIVIFTPYNRLILDKIFSKTDLESTLIDRKNYVFVTADWRGFHASRRSRKWFWQRQASSKQIGQDGYDLVEWVARQSWSNGKVGMWGASALGQAQYRTAAENPPHLTCICPIAIRFWESYKQHYYDGCPKYGRTLARDQAGFRGTSKKVTQHPVRDSFWDEIETRTRQGLEKIDVPVLVIGGWYDLETSCLIETFQELKSRARQKTREHAKLLIGPWDHVNVAAGRLKVGEKEYQKAHRESELEAHRFFAYWLRGQKNAWPRRRDIRYFQLGDERWQEVNQWPPKWTKEHTLYLGHNHTLAEVAPKSESSASWTADPNEPTPTLGGNNISVFWRKDRLKVEAGSKEQSALLSRDDVLSFSSNKLSSALVVTGQVKVSVHMMTDCRDTDLMVRLCDLHPNGTCMLVTDGARRARFRKTTRREDFVLAEKKFVMDVTLPVIAHTFKKGHAIKLIFSSSNYPRFAVNPQNGRHYTSRWRRNKVAVNSLFYGGKSSSSVTFPCLVRNNELIGESTSAKPKKEAKHYERKGPYSVYIREFPSLQDESRENLSVPIKVFYPDRDGPFPLVVVTHGGGGIGMLLPTKLNI